jgi:hypothetical protein
MRGQPNKDNPERLATKGTQDEDKNKQKTTQYVLGKNIHKNTKNVNKT